MAAESCQPAAVAAAAVAAGQRQPEMLSHPLPP